MKKIKQISIKSLITLLLISVAFTSCSDDEITNEPISIIESSNPIQGQYTVVLNSDYQGKSSRKVLKYDDEMVQLRKEIPSLFSELDLVDENLKQTYGFALKGFTAVLDDLQLEKLKNDPRVKSIEQDYLITLAKPDHLVEPTVDPAQETPWGITRVGGGINATGKTAWIVDSGIDSDHPDLVVDVSRSRSYLTRGRYSIEDGNGHGTHVAGTVAAIDNTIGVVGVAPGATIVALRVLDNRGSGDFSWTIAALDYVAASASIGDAVNMSLGPTSRYTDTAVDAAVTNVADLGIKIAIAAGNASDDALYYSPARVNHTNVYTVSAMDNTDTFAYFSNYGTPVDVSGPGVSVYSTYKEGGYATLNGTSMASPHVCGLLLLGNITTDGFVSGDPDGNPDPIAHN